jgi:hypothetical protein
MGFLNYFDAQVGSLLLSAFIGFTAGAVLFIKRSQFTWSRQRIEAIPHRPARRC